ncbi:MAG: hypothetical protein M1817_006574 [Caeruleum heppii]|nr:MAG: hypothetical protein M1817_006574 [Caeruleum heppii]
MFESGYTKGLILSCLILAASSQTIVSPSPADALRENSAETGTRNITLPSDVPINTPFHDTVIDNAMLVAALPVEPPIDLTTVESVPLPNSLFELRDRVTEKRQLGGDVKYRLQFSHGALESVDHRLFAIHASKEIVDEVLRNAVAVADAQDPTQYRDSFRSTTANLTLIVNAIGSTSARPTFTWNAYRAVASILLNATTSIPSNTTGSWVGVVKNPSGTIVAELVLIPDAINIPPDPSAGSIVAIGQETVAQGGKHRLTKRVIMIERPVSNLGDFILGFSELEFVPVSGWRLVQIMDEVVDEVTSNNDVLGYREFVYGDMTVPRMIDTLPSGQVHLPGFRFRTINNHRILRSPMRRIVRELHRIVSQYRALYQGTARALQGHLEFRGQIVATWTIAVPPPPEITEGAVCPVEQQRGGRGTIGQVGPPNAIPVLDQVAPDAVPSRWNIGHQLGCILQ